MALNYRVVTREEDLGRNVSDPGDYPFTVLKFEQKKTKPGFDKDGNEKEIFNMYEVELLYHNQDGREKLQRDWIVMSPLMDWKFRHFASSIGQLDKYEAGTLDEKDIIGKSGVFTLGIRDYTDQKTGEVKKSNNVKDYVESAASQKSAEGAPFVDDDIKF